MKLYIKKNIKETMKAIKSEYAKSIYIALLKKSRGLSFDMSEMYITLNELCYLLTGEFNNGEKQWKRKMKSSLEQAIEELNDKGIIEILNQAKEEYIIDAYDLLYIEQEDVLDTRTGKEKIKNNDKFEVFEFDLITRYYNSFGAKGINFLFDYLYEINNDAYFMCGRDEVNDNFNIDIKTFDKYIDFLEQEKIIYVYRYSCKYANSGKTPKNMYGMNNSYVVDKINECADKHIKENEMTSGVVVKGISKAELQAKKAHQDEFEAWQESLEQAFNEFKPIVIKRGFGNSKKGNLEPIKIEQEIKEPKRVFGRKAIVEPVKDSQDDIVMHQNEPQQEINVEMGNCKATDGKANTKQFKTSQYFNRENFTAQEIAQGLKNEFLKKMYHNKKKNCELQGIKFIDDLGFEQVKAQVQEYDIANIM